MFVKPEEKLTAGHLINILNKKKEDADNQEGLIKIMRNYFRRSFVDSSKKTREEIQRRLKHDNCDGLGKLHYDLSVQYFDHTAGLRKRSGEHQIREIAKGTGLPASTIREILLIGMNDYCDAYIRPVTSYLEKFHLTSMLKARVLPLDVTTFILALEYDNFRFIRGSEDREFATLEYNGFTALADFEDFLRKQYEVFNGYLQSVCRVKDRVSTRVLLNSVIMRFRNLRNHYEAVDDTTSRITKFVRISTTDLFENEICEDHIVVDPGCGDRLASFTTLQYDYILTAGENARELYSTFTLSFIPLTEKIEKQKKQMDKRLPVVVDAMIHTTLLKLLRDFVGYFPKMNNIEFANRSSASFTVNGDADLPANTVNSYLTMYKKEKLKLWRDIFRYLADVIDSILLHNRGSHKIVIPKDIEPWEF